MHSKNSVVYKMVFLAIMFVVIVGEVGGCECPSCNYATTAQNCQCCIYRQLGKRFSPSVPSYLEDTIPILPILEPPEEPKYSSKKRLISDVSQLGKRFSPRFISKRRVPLYFDNTIPNLSIMPPPEKAKYTYRKSLISDVSQGDEGKNILGGDAIQASVREIYNAQRDTLMSKLSDIARDIDNINLSKAVVSSLEDEE